MKLSKANEETLKGLAKLLKNILEGAPFGQSAEIKGLEKDLRQLRKNLKEMPEPEMATAEFSKEGVAETYANLDNTSKDAWRIVVFAEMKERLALPDGDEARIGPNETLRELNLIDCKAVNQCAKIDFIEPQVGQIESEFEETPAFYANPKQIEAKSALIGVKFDGPDENRTLALYRKKS